MKTIKTDYLIIGAGLAGSTLGFLLSRDGADVLNVEIRDIRDKDKLCAGFLNSYAVKSIAEVFGEDAIDQIRATDSLPWIWRNSGREVVWSGRYRVVRRKVLDDYCLRRLLETGGSVHDRTRLVSVDMGERLAVLRDMRAREEYAVRFGEIVGADGALSSVRKLLTGRCGRSVLSFEGVVPATFTEEIVTGVDPNVFGYSWYAPRGADATVGCLYAGLDATTCKEHLESFCADLGIAMPGLRGAFIPSGDDVLLRAGEHAWLVGDAAGLADAFGGGGIHNAFMSALRLAESFAGGRRYEEGMNDQVLMLGVAARTAKSMPTMIWRSILMFGTDVSRTNDGQR